MSHLKRCALAGLALALAVGSTACSDEAAITDPAFAQGGGGKPTPSEGSNNLSFPVIWSDGQAKALPTGTTPGMIPVLDGTWWYWWGTTGIDPDIVPLSCPPDPDDTTLCDDGIPLAATGAVPGEGYPADSLVKAYLQKAANNLWAAAAGTPTEMGFPEGRVAVNRIDWGDNLESVDWYTKSQVRTEVVLFQDNLDPLNAPWLEYQMRHTSGWGIDEVHGLAATVTADEPMVGLGDIATVYTHCARLTIQKLRLPREDAELENLVWVPGEGWDEPEGYEGALVNDAIFNLPVYEGGDGPGYYSAEINVKGRIIYGYTWNVRKLNDDGGGDYRITFSMDEVCGPATLNTFFVDGVTEIMVPLEEEEVVAVAEEGDDGGESPGGGATGVLVPAEFDEYGNLVGGNLTYIDVRILERGGGGGG